MDFNAAAESLDGGVHVVSVTGEIDLGAASAVRSRRRFDRSGGSFAIASPNRTLLKVLEITQLDRHFAIYPSRTAALDGDGNH